MVQCTGFAKSTGVQCRKDGDSTMGNRCIHHQTCRGVKSDESPCGSRPVEGYDGYCSAAHDPTKNRYKPQYFRLDEKEMAPLRENVRGHGQIVDVYTAKRLKRWNSQCDHVVELQMAAHVMNRVSRRYHFSDQEIDNIVPVVREFVNVETNLGFTHEDINKLKGAGTKLYLDKIAYSLNPSWTTCLKDSNEQLNANEIQGMYVPRLRRHVTRAITEQVGPNLKQLQRDLEREQDNGAMARVISEVKKLRVAISK